MPNVLDVVGALAVLVTALLGASTAHHVRVHQRKVDQVLELGMTAPKNIRSPSTTFSHEHDSLRRAARPEGQLSRQGHPSSLRTRDPRKRLDMQVKSLGGPTDGWVIESRGVRWYVDGGVSLADAMRWVNGCPGYRCGTCYA